MSGLALFLCGNGEKEVGLLLVFVLGSLRNLDCWDGATSSCMAISSGGVQRLLQSCWGEANHISIIIICLRNTTSSQHSHDSTTSDNPQSPNPHTSWRSTSCTRARSPRTRNSRLTAPTLRPRTPSRSRSTNRRLRSRRRTPRNLPGALAPRQRKIKTNRRLTRELIAHSSIRATRHHDVRERREDSCEVRGWGPGAEGVGGRCYDCVEGGCKEG